MHFCTHETFNFRLLAFIKANTNFATYLILNIIFNKHLEHNNHNGLEVS